MKVIDKPIELYDAHIHAITHKIKDGAISSKLSCVASINTDLAEKLGCKSILYENGVSRDGFSSVELDVMVPVFRAVFECDGLKQTLHINGDQGDGFLVESTKDGLRLKFKLGHHGDPLTALSYLMAVGTAQGVCKITPLQETLDLADSATATLEITGKDGSKSSTVIPPEMMQQALLKAKTKGKPS